MGVVREWLDAYAAGTVDYAALRGFVAAHRFACPDWLKNRPTDQPALELHVEDRLDIIGAQEDTWEEIDEARSRGVLTRAQLVDLSRAVQDRPRSLQT